MSVDRLEQTRDGGERVVESLSPIKHKALLALLEDPHVEKAAGVGKSTLHMWLQKDMDFREAYREARREAYSIHVARLQSATAIAVDALIEIADDKNQQGATRVGAAKAILDNKDKATEKEDFMARLEKIEEEVEEEEEETAA